MKHNPSAMMMNRAVLLLGAVFAALYIFSSTVAAEDYFFNQELVGRTSLDNINRSVLGPPKGEIPRSPLREDTQSGILFREIDPLKKFSRPEPVFADSIDIDRGIVTRYSIQTGGIPVPQYTIALDEHVRRRFSHKESEMWSNNSGRVTEWTETRRTGGVRDLDFVIPLGDRLTRMMGGGETSIRIDGSQRIEFSGRSSWTEGEVQTWAQRNSTFPSLTMKQEPQFSVKGTIADRITVDIRQDPVHGFSNLEENIRLTYRGEENDIIKFIEAGNTSLSLEGATFAGYRGSHKGLFGIRGEGQLGPLKVTAIASQEKSESGSRTFRGSAEESSLQINDYEYKRNTYFFVDNIYRERFANARDSFDAIMYLPADSLVHFEVYLDDNIMSNNLNPETFALRGIASPMNMNPADPASDPPIEGFFHRLVPIRDYYVDRSLGFIRFTNPIPDDATVGVFLETKDGRRMGSLSYDAEDENSHISLKLIKRRRQRPSDSDTWKLEWKNVYSLGQRNISEEGLEIKIMKKSTDGIDLPSQNGVPFIQILGLDKTGVNSPLPDNRVDLNRGLIDFVRGELIFPLLEPFNTQHPPAGFDEDKYILQDRVSEIYNTQNMNEIIGASKYYIEVKTANRQSVYRLGSITEGSEQVILNGRQLTRNTDYRVEYFTGQITILNEEALSPSANLVINYEQPTLFQQTQKSLFGLRGEYSLFSNSKIGGVMLLKNETTPERRVRLGQEPSRTLLLDADAQFNFESRAVTSALDKLPLLVASTPSTFRIEGEVAKSLPTMNTRGVVYIDDFESSQNTPLSVMRPNWTPASVPDVSTTGGVVLSRGKLIWYNPWRRVNSRDIWPNKETATGENTTHVLTMEYQKPPDVPKENAYAGVMTAFWGSGVDLSSARFIEIWAKGSKGDLKINLGAISEDWYNAANPSSSLGDGILQTEDRAIPGLGYGDGVLTQDKDTGLKGYFSEQSPLYDRITNPNPYGDKYHYDMNNPDEYSRINGMEGNGVLDTEDINRNGILDTRNAYYEYTISMEDRFDPYLVEDSVPPNDPNGWRLFRIPLWDNPLCVIGGENPDSTRIEFARIWITNTDSTTIHIASMDITENNWLEQGIFEGDEQVSTEYPDRIRAAVVNTHDNREYTSPPGVRGEINRETRIRTKEQSLVLQAERLGPSRSAFIYRNFDRMDFTDYTALKMYVHGPPEFPQSGEDESPVELIIRFGADRNNYYEYRTPVWQGWDRENYVEIDFDKCTALKMLPGYNDYAAHPDSFPAVYDITGTKVYTIRGRPSLDNVRVISIGVKNNNGFYPLDSDIWVNELRMDSLRNMDGTAARINFNSDFAGFVNVTARGLRRSADFHDLNSTKGSGQDLTEWSSSVSANLDRLTPRRWNLSMPVSASMSSRSNLPRLMSGSDILLDPASRKEFESWGEESRYSIAFRKAQDPTLTGMTGRLINWTFEKFSGNFDWSQSRAATPRTGYNENLSKQFRGTYDVGPKERTVKLLEWLPRSSKNAWEKFADLDFAYTPSQLTYNLTYVDTERLHTGVDGNQDTTHVKELREVVTLRYNPLRDLRYNYTLTKSADLFLGKEVSYQELNNITFTGPAFRYLTNRYSYQATYNETDNPRYSLSSQLGSRTIAFNKAFTASGDFAWDKLLDDLSGKPKPATPRYVREKFKDAQETERTPSLSMPMPVTPPPVTAKSTEPSMRERIFSRVAKSLSPLTLSYRRNSQIGYSGVEERPGFFERFGADTISPPDSISVVSRDNYTTETNSWDANTRLNLPMDIGLRISTRFNKEDRSSPSVNMQREDLTLPDMSLTWTRVENKIPQLKKYLSNVSINSGYSSVSSKTWQNMSEKPVTDTRTTRFAPLIGINASIMNEVNANITYNVNTIETNDFAGGVGRYSIRDTRNMSATFRYRLTSSTGLPIVRNLNLKSGIDISASISTNYSDMKSRVGNQPLVRISRNDSWTFSPRADYQFSQKYRGGMRMNFSNSKDMSNRIRKVREVSIWGEMQF